MKQTMMIIFFLVFIGVLVGVNIYLAKRFAFYFGFEKTLPFYIMFAATTIFMLVGTFSLINSTSNPGHVLFGIAAIALGFMLYLLISTIFVDIISLAYKTRPIYYGFASISLALLISVYGMWNATNLKVTELEIPMKGLERSVRVAHLTDTHLGHFRGGKKLQKIVDEINKQDVDIVFFTGDLLDSKYQLKKESMNPLANLDAPVYFVEGNHDEYTGVDAIKRYLRSIGVNVLENEVVHWNELQIIGLTFMLADGESASPHASPNGPNVKNMLGSMNINKDKPTVLLHHGPDGVQYANQAGVDLYLAGHTHAGQLWPITHVAKMMFKYNRGLYDYNGTKIYVCQGTGTFGPPMRIGTDSELAIINLIPE